jgi:hypothetical protein
MSALAAAFLEHPPSLIPAYNTGDRIRRPMDSRQVAEAAFKAATVHRNLVGCGNGALAFIRAGRASYHGPLE